jgi:hypothetical protein
MLHMCEYAHAIKRFEETRSQIQYPMVVQVGGWGGGSGALGHQGTTNRRGKEGFNNNAAQPQP